MTSSTLEQPVDEQEDLRGILNNQITRQGAGLATEVASGLALDAKTQWMLGAGPWGWLGYGITNFAGGATANIAAQRMRGEEETNWGEVLSSGLLGIIPFTSLRFGKQATNILGEAGTIKRAVVGGAGMGAGDRFIQSGINEGELPSPTDVAIGTVLGGTFGGVFQKSFTEAAKILNKYQGKTVQEINQTLTPRERSQLTTLQKQILKVRDDPKAVAQAIEAYKEANFNYEKSQGLHKNITDYNQYRQVTKDISNQLKNQMSDDPYYKDLYNFSDEHVHFTTPNPRSFKRSDNIQWNRKSILKREAKLRDLEASRETSYQKALKLAGGDPSKVNRNIYEQYAGPGKLSEVEAVAKKLNAEGGRGDGTFYTIADVVKYFEYNEYQLRQLEAARVMLNNWGRRDTVDRMRSIMEKYAKDKKIKNSLEYRRYLSLIKSLDNARSGIWTKGHKDAIKDVFMRGESGGNRITNLMLESGIDRYFRQQSGELRRIKGNISKQNRPIDKYALVQLAGGSWDLEDDFIRIVDPGIWAGNPSNIGNITGLPRPVFDGTGLAKFGDFYTEIATEAYDKLLREFLLSENIKINSEEGRRASAAIVDGLVAWFELFDQMQRRGVGDLTTGLKNPIDLVNAEDYWFEGVNTIGARTVKEDRNRSAEVDALESAFLKAFKKIWKPK